MEAAVNREKLKHNRSEEALEERSRNDCESTNSPTIWGRHLPVRFATPTFMCRDFFCTLYVCILFNFRVHFLTEDCIGILYWKLISCVSSCLPTSVYRSKHLHEWTSWEFGSPPTTTKRFCMDLLFQMNLETSCKSTSAADSSRETC
jgi:hypothetical protein